MPNSSQRWKEKLERINENAKNIPTDRGWSGVEKVTTESLMLRDIICVGSGPDDPSFAYNRSTVVEITEETITSIRPYLHCADFSTGNEKKKVIHYMGWEYVTVFRDDYTIVWLLRRDPLTR